MNALEKINKIFAYLENNSENSVEDHNQILERQAKEREEFLNVLIDNLKSKKISYDEAVARAKMFAKSDLDLSIMLARLGEYEVLLNKKASINSDMEVNTMKNISIDEAKLAIERLKKRLPKYGAWLENVLKKEGWFLGTGDKVPIDEYDTGVAKEEEKRKNESIKEGEKLMKEYETERERQLRASLKVGEDKKRDIRESTKIDPDEYDNGAAKEDDARWHAQVREGEKLMKEYEKERERQLRATKELFDVRFSKDENNIRESTWQIIDKTDGKIIVSATLDDILEGREIDDGALAEMQSKEFGDIILEEIAENGIVSTAKMMLGPKFEKLAAVGEIEDEENPDLLEEEEEDVDLGLHTTSPETEEKIQKDEEEGKDTLSEHLEDEDIVTEKDLKKYKEPSEDELEAIASKYFMYKGIIAELKPTLSKFAKETKVSGIENLIKVAEEKLEEVKDIIDGNKKGDLPMAMTAVVEAVGDVSSVSDLIEEAKSLAANDPKLLEILDKIAEKVSAVAEEEAAEGETEEAEILGVEEGGKEMDIEKEDKEKKDTEQNKEEKEKKEEKGKKAEANLVDRLRKLAARDKGDYDVTPKANFEKEFHGDDKGKVSAEGTHFHNIWEVAKELEALGGKKAAGKIAKIIEDMKKFAEERGIDPKTYFNNILEDSKYVNEYLKTKTPDDVIKEWEKATKNTDNVYASIVTKVKLAYKTALNMQKKGLIKNSEADLDAQINRLIAMDENTFNAYVDAIEAIAPTTELEDGRFKVTAVHTPGTGLIIQGYIDGIPVCNITTEEIGTPGKVTKEGLQKAISMIKTALENHLFDSILSDGVIPDTIGESNLGGLNLGIEDVLS